MRLPFPDAMYPSPDAIPLSDLRRMGLRGLLLDIDGTLAPTHVPRPNPAICRWMEDMRAGGIRLFILSNNRHSQRVEQYAALAGAPWLHQAHKPKPQGFLQAAQALGLPPGELGVVGDQIFTDVLGARRCGMRALLVESSDTALWYFYPRRLLEIPFMKVKSL